MQQTDEDRLNLRFFHVFDGTTSKILWDILAASKIITKAFSRTFNYSKLVKQIDQSFFTNFDTIYVLFLHYLSH